MDRFDWFPGNMVMLKRSRGRYVLYTDAKLSLAGKEEQIVILRNSIYALKKLLKKSQSDNFFLQEDLDRAMLGAPRPGATPTP